jgi:hypothetical protein
MDSFRTRDNITRESQVFVFFFFSLVRGRQSVIYDTDAAATDARNSTQTRNAHTHGPQTQFQGI